jgi:hypothetical protein
VSVHYHGTPISPRSTLAQLAGRHFCVSYARPTDVAVCHRIGQSVMLDNGAYSAWRFGFEIDWNEWAVWAERWLVYPTTWAVLPDSVDGGVAENDRLLDLYADEFLPSQVAPVWHLDEPLERLRWLCSRFDRVCFGSSDVYANIASVAWRRRVGEAFDAIANPETGRVPWIHMLRGMSRAGDVFPFASLDSTDVARNHNRPHNTAARMAERWDAIQCPPTWNPVDQLTLEKEVAS